MIIVEMFEMKNVRVLEDHHWEALEESGWDCDPENQVGELVCVDEDEAFSSFKECTEFNPKSPCFRFYVGKDQVNV